MHMVQGVLLTAVCCSLHVVATPIATVGSIRTRPVTIRSIRAIRGIGIWSHVLLRIAGIFVAT